MPGCTVDNHVGIHTSQDDMFNLDIERAKEIMRLIIEKGLQLPFTFPNGLRPDLLDEERSPFTRQREAQIREEMREYDRSKSRRE